MMITCPECKAEYSDQAKACIHCGAKNPKKMSGGSKFGIFALVIIGLFIAFLVIGNMAYDPKEHALSDAIARCRKDENDQLLSIGARRLARDACEMLAQRYKDNYGRAP